VFVNRCDDNQRLCSAGPCRGRDGEGGQGRRQGSEGNMEGSGCKDPTEGYAGHEALGSPCTDHCLEVIGT